MAQPLGGQRRIAQLQAVRAHVAKVRGKTLGFLRYPTRLKVQARPNLNAASSPYPRQNRAKRGGLLVQEQVQIRANTRQVRAHEAASASDFGMATALREDARQHSRRIAFKLAGLNEQKRLRCEHPWITRDVDFMVGEPFHRRLCRHVHLFAHIEVDWRQRAVLGRLFQVFLPLAANALFHIRHERRDLFRVARLRRLCLNLRDGYRACRLQPRDEFLVGFGALKLRQPRLGTRQCCEVKPVQFRVLQQFGNDAIPLGGVAQHGIVTHFVAIL
ncbi:hypothetical protein GALL_515390 [mine drainage metagenome]|uniref:Uncharacterized protein n=1 Tax=mine drainage metagenome TaxID=410659 RepID=A0A1J5P5T1_9ZZZZ